MGTVPSPSGPTSRVVRPIRFRVPRSTVAPQARRRHASASGWDCTRETPDGTGTGGEPLTRRNAREAGPVVRLRLRHRPDRDVGDLGRPGAAPAPDARL